MTKQTSDLAKFYFNDQNKYGGEDLYDFLDQKVVIFHDYCEKVGLPRSQHHWAFSIMLKGRAAGYYYDEIVGNASSIKQMIEMIKLHFETGERTQALLKVWRETTLHKIFTDDPDKNRLEWRGRGRGKEGRAYGSDFQQRQKKCYVGGKRGCWSTEYPQEVRRMAYSRFCTQYTHSSEPNLANYEGIQGIEDLVEDKDKDVDETQYILDNMHIEDEFKEDDFETEAYFSDDLGRLNGIQILTHLQNQSVWHLVRISDPFEEASIQETQANDILSFDGRYNEGVFQGIMPDTGVAGVSTVGKPQFCAL
ncbi:hypothetical protein HI914_07279 [Erysiphe necator]|nr:hypothetical protein HI914_07279 [Erysiphe necator]